MRLLSFVSAFAVSLGLATFPARADTGADDAFGLWNDPSNGGHIELAHCADKLCGKIVFVPDNDGKDGPKTDKNNPDADKRNQPILGLTIVENAYKADSKSWKGSIYNPVDGKTYAVTLTPKSPAELDLTGCLMTILCRTSTWTRLQP
jgi:uncharacterized protein (DUF2147 family)